MKSKVIFSVLILLLVVGCSTHEKERTPSEIQSQIIQNEKKVNQLAIKNGLDSNKIHFDFEDKILKQEEWDELDKFFFTEGQYALKNKDRFAYNSELFKFTKEMHARVSPNQGKLIATIYPKMKYEKGKTLRDLYEEVVKYPELFSKELILDLGSKLDK